MRDLREHSSDLKKATTDEIVWYRKQNTETDASERVLYTCGQFVGQSSWGKEDRCLLWVGRYSSVAV